jgi:hypothetical protein
MGLCPIPVDGSLVVEFIASACQLLPMTTSALKVTALRTALLMFMSSPYMLQLIEITGCVHSSSCRFFMTIAECMPVLLRL